MGVWHPCWQDYTHTRTHTHSQSEIHNIYTVCKNIHILTRAHVGGHIHTKTHTVTQGEVSKGAYHICHCNHQSLTEAVINPKNTHTRTECWPWGSRLGRLAANEVAACCCPWRQGRNWQGQDTHRHIHEPTLPYIHTHMNKTSPVILNNEPGSNFVIFINHFNQPRWAYRFRYFTLATPLLGS